MSPSHRVRLLLVRYADETAARAALEHFRAAYLPETARLGAVGTGLAKVEDGWTGWRLAERALAVVLGAPDEVSGAALLAASSGEGTKAGS